MKENFDLRAFDAALAECVDALKQGTTVDECLARYPQFAAQLKSYLTVAQVVDQKLRDEPVTLPRTSRAAILERAANAKRRNNSSAIVGGGLFERLRELFRAPQLAFSALAVVLVLVASGVLINLSTASLPNDTLYPIKRVAENVQLFFTFDPAARADWLLTLAERRSTEIRALLARNETIDPALFADLRNTLTAALDEIGHLRGESASGLLDRAIALTQTQTNFLSAAAENANPSQQDELRNAADAVNQIRERAEEGRKNPQFLQTPEPTQTLQPTSTATATAVPSTQTPTPTSTPQATATPAPNRAPASPQVNDTPKATQKPEATDTPNPNNSPQPTEPPEQTRTPNPNNSPQPTEPPEQTRTPTPNNSPQPTEQTRTPTPNNTPVGAQTRQPTQTPNPFDTPQPTPTPN